MNARAIAPFAAAVAVLLGVYFVGYVSIWRWMICRIEVPAGQSLLLRYKGPFPFGSAERVGEGELVKMDESGRPEKVGILEVMPGPGRHFYSPFEFETELVPDTIIKPGQLGVVTSRTGKPLPPGAYLVDQEGFRGVLRKVLTPGRYRMNKYAFDVKVVDVDACVRTRSEGARKAASGLTMIAPGYVGVVTNKTNNPTTGETQGIQENVLQPGIYFLNPEEKQVDIISVGFNETTLSVEVDRQATAERDRRLAAEGQAPGTSTDKLGKVSKIDPIYAAGKGLEFPSNDGFLIHLDYTAIWGILPDQAPDVVKQFGTLKDVEEKVILPQIGSICRLHGSKRGAVDLLVGDSREEFQTDTSEELEKVLLGKNLTLLFGLTRHIYVPAQVREPIQKGKIADELTKTREQEQLTEKARGDLTEAKAKVVFEEQKTKAETEKMVAQVAAEAEKKSKEIEAETEKLRAEIDAKTAEVEAQTSKAMGEATAKTTELTRKAEAERFKLYVQALGGPEAYNRYEFANTLPPDIRLGIFYAGPGTFWTDLKGLEQSLLGKVVSETLEKSAPAKPAMVAPTSASGSQ